VILTNPTSKNGLTQLVGRILRQPFARKTGVRELDESYVFCFQQRAGALLESIRQGFAQEGLCDLRGHIATEDEVKGEGEGKKDRLSEIRGRFKETASRTILPVFMVKEGSGWRPVNYEVDIAARIPWEEVNLDPVKSLTLSMFEEKDKEHVATLSEDSKEVVRQVAVIELKEGGIRVDPVFMTRQLCDVIPNPWQAHDFAKTVLNHFRTTSDERVLANNFVFLIEELRKRLEQEKERLAEKVFCGMLEQDQLRFLIIADRLDWTFPLQLTVKPTAKTLTRKDVSQLQLSLLEFVPEDDFNETEKAVAWYLENQTRLFFWFRNRARHDYSIQGWRQHRIYPDFIFTAQDKSGGGDYERVYVVETKGLHIKDNAKTEYIRKVFDICTKQAESRDWGELGLQMKDKVIRFEVLAEDEWEAKLNGILQG
jgi:type III restriction enzyme